MITTSSIDHFFDYVTSSKVVEKTHIPSALLAHTFTAFVLMGLAGILWILFKPSRRPRAGGQDYTRVSELLKHHSNSSEDFFKLWPPDKQYFWNEDKTGFVAYKVVGSIAFALPDPIAANNQRNELIKSFMEWNRAHRLRTCFLPIYSDPKMYEAAGLSSLQMGASAVITIKTFLNETMQDKWWRWQRNRAIKAGYEYRTASPPHSSDFIAALQHVSNAWLGSDEHQERGFALGYFDNAYMQQCLIHYAVDQSNQVVAFANQLPEFRPTDTVTVDLMRALPTADQAMSYLLSKIIEQLGESGQYQKFDLGFVPFATSRGPIVRVAKTLGAGRFSAKGLERFKNKFDPTWQPNYLAYDGDLGDLTLVAANLEKVMRR